EKLQSNRPGSLSGTSWLENLADAEPNTAQPAYSSIGYLGSAAPEERSASPPRGQGNRLDVPPPRQNMSQRSSMPRTRRRRSKLPFPWRNHSQLQLPERHRASMSPPHSSRQETLGLQFANHHHQQQQQQHSTSHYLYSSRPLSHVGCPSPADYSLDEILARS